MLLGACREYHGDIKNFFVFYIMASYDILYLYFFKKTERCERMDDLEKEFTGFLSNMIKSYGLGDLPAKVIGVLYLEPQEISMEDITTKTGYSLASISNTMKILENTGVVQRIKKPGTKKVFFYMEKNLAKLNIKKIAAIHDNMIKSAKEMLPPIIDKYQHKAGDKKSKQKLKLIKDYYTQILQFEELLQDMTKKLKKMSAINDG